MKKIVLLALVFTQFGFAQNRTCGMQQQMQQMMSNPVLKQKFIERQARFMVELEKLETKQANKSNGYETSTPATTIRIPVAVHYPSGGSANETLKTCLRAFAQNQVDILNADYNALNSDLSNWAAASAFYPGVSVGDLNVQFELATQNHPAGTTLVNGDVAVTFGTDFLFGNDYDTTWSGYMSFVVRNIGGGILGYSPLGGSPAEGMTVVMDNNAFASGSGCVGYVPGAPYNLGRTVTHELGHFFNLDHTFNGCGEGNCAVVDPSDFLGDGVCDTPSVGEETYGCPANGSVDGCVPGQKSLTMNYMDYTNDACMYMFTLGQQNRMLAYINAISSEFNSDVLSNNEVVINNFTIYPVPNNGSFTINFKNLTDRYAVEVHDMTGRVVYANSFNQNSSLTQPITLDNTSKGVYFITVKSNDVVVTKKISIE